MKLKKILLILTLLLLLFTAIYLVLNEDKMVKTLPFEGETCEEVDFFMISNYDLFGVFAVLTSITLFLIVFMFFIGFVWLIIDLLRSEDKGNGSK
jgi:hypothetical protein